MSTSLLVPRSLLSASARRIQARHVASLTTRARLCTSSTRSSSVLHLQSQSQQLQQPRHRQLRAMASTSTPQDPSAGWLDRSTGEPYQHILTSSPAQGVALITLNRPKALNALCAALIAELNDALDRAEKDDSVGVVIITGSERAFAAGADIKEMNEKEYHDVTNEDFLANWHRLAGLRKPAIAAVSGHALGGGCELAMMCDIILASPTAIFGQPEIDLGVIPGAGGTQRLTRLIGQSRAMEVVLSGRRFSAEEAEKWGLVTRVVVDTSSDSPNDKGKAHAALLEEAVKLAGTIASKSQVAVRAAKECVRKASEMSLGEGLVFERRAFHSLFATKDQKEGMSAFVEKRKPKFSNL